MSKPDGGPAYPRSATIEDPGEYGMTLRQWYAGQVLAGIQSTDMAWGPEETAEYCFQMADSMIAHEAGESE